MSTEAREIVDAIRAAYRERTGGGTLYEATSAAPRTERGRWAIADDGYNQYAALAEIDGFRIWWRREFMTPEWQPYRDVTLPRVLWMPADPANLPAGFTLPEVGA